MKKQRNKGKSLKVKEKLSIEKIRNRWFIAIIIVLTFVLYINTGFNHFSMDDYHVTASNTTISQGIKAIPEIFSTLYAIESGLSYGYRPLVRISFAIEHELFNGNPYLSHFFNTLLYLIAGLLLFKVLKRLFRNYNVYFPFVVTLLFIAHPLHSEVVASLKNRDELLNLIFCLLALLFFVKWVDFKKIKFLITGLIFYVMALLSKETAMGFLFIFPLVLYFFTDIKQKKLLYFSGVVVIIALIAAGGPFLYLPEFDREIWFMENPLSAEENIWNRFATAFYILLFYVKKLFYPFPMLYYYGYNMIPVVSWANIWAIISLIFYLGIFIYAILNFKKKHILSFAILFFLITIAMYSNILMPVPGIVGDRFMLFPSLAFALIIAYFLFKIFRLSPKAQKISSGNISKVLIVLFIILIPYSVLTFNRNKDWRTHYSLYNADIKYLENSVKANDLLATELIKQVDKDLRSKPVNVLKFLRPTINRAIKHYKKALEIYPEHYSSWNNLGTIYTRLYKEHELAISCFEKCIKYKPDFPNVYFNMGMAYENLENLEKALEYYSECYKMDTTNIFPMSRIANLNFKNGNFEEAININNQLIISAPESDIPYINLGNYYFAISDTTKAMYFYRKAIEKGSQTNVSMILYNYYKEKGDWLKANYYFRKAKQEGKAKQGDRK